MNIHKLNEKLQKINGLKLIPHREKADRNYKKAFEYFKNNPDKVKRGFTDIPIQTRIKT